MEENDTIYYKSLKRKLYKKSKVEDWRWNKNGWNLTVLVWKGHASKKYWIKNVVIGVEIVQICR